MQWKAHRRHHSFIANNMRISELIHVKKTSLFTPPTHTLPLFRYHGKQTFDCNWRRWRWRWRSREAAIRWSSSPHNLEVVETCCLPVPYEEENFHPLLIMSLCSGSELVYWRHPMVDVGEGKWILYGEPVDTVFLTWSVFNLIVWIQMYWFEVNLFVVSLTLRRPPREAHYITKTTVRYWLHLVWFDINLFWVDLIGFW